MFPIWSLGFCSPTFTLVCSPDCSLLVSKLKIKSVPQLKTCRRLESQKLKPKGLTWPTGPCVLGSMRLHLTLLCLQLCSPLLAFCSTPASLVPQECPSLALVPVGSPLTSVRYLELLWKVLKCSARVTFFSESPLPWPPYFELQPSSPCKCIPDTPFPILVGSVSLAQGRWEGSFVNWRTLEMLCLCTWGWDF